VVYHNDGKGRFTDITRQAGFTKPGKGLGIAIADFNRDGHIDVCIANDSIPEFLYQNRGDGTFEEAGLFSGVAVDGEGHAYAGMGVDFADYNNDGLPDLAISDLAYQKYALYRNRGDGTFVYSTDSSGLGAITFLHSGWGLRFLDYDNDGWKDLLVVQAHVLDTVELAYPQLRYRERMFLARNTGKGFVDVSTESGAVFQEAWASRGLALGDIDNDGRIDAVVTTNGGTAHILRNQTDSHNHWLLLNLVGHKGNRDAIGASVKIVSSQGIETGKLSLIGR
jgi:enediyne biosynthesis protein E4